MTASSPGRHATLSHEDKISIIPESLDVHRELRPDAVALQFGNRFTTYAELHERVDQVAQTLRRWGARKSERVLYLGKNSDQFIALLYGAMRAGVVLTPLNWRLAPAEAQIIAEDSHARLLIAGPEAPEDVLRRLRDLAPLEVVSIENPEGKVLGDLSQADASTGPFPISADDIALQLYTSGTTGRPKGVMLSHRSFLEPLIERRRIGVEWEALAPGDTAIVDLPMYHLGGTHWPMIGLHAGASLLLTTEFSPSFIIQAFEQKHNIPILVMVPTTMQLLLEASEGSSEQFESLKYIRYGGSPISEGLLERCQKRFGCRFAQTYGSTETGGAVTVLGADDHVLPPTRRMRSAGRAFSDVELAIADKEGQRLGPGMTGEILVRSPSNMAGYWRRPEATAATLSADGWLRTGDAGYIDEEGFLYIQDRLSDMIITGGENVYPAEVENVLGSHSSVAEAAVVGVPDPRWGEAVKAFIVLKEGEAATPGDLIKFCSDRLSRYKCPKSIEIVDGLPHNASGKILRRILRDGIEIPE
jgi:acyl-CoA synthetase (AMP-forming)/AMP-acid ligase II